MLSSGADRMMQAIPELPIPSNYMWISFPSSSRRSARRLSRPRFLPYGASRRRRERTRGSPIGMRRPRRSPSRRRKCPACRPPGRMRPRRLPSPFLRRQPAAGPEVPAAPAACAHAHAASSSAGGGAKGIDTNQMSSEALLEGLKAWAATKNLSNDKATLAAIQVSH